MSRTFRYDQYQERVQSEQRRSARVAKQQASCTHANTSTVQTPFGSYVVCNSCDKNLGGN